MDSKKINEHDGLRKAIDKVLEQSEQLPPEVVASFIELGKQVDALNTAKKKEEKKRRAFDVLKYIFRSFEVWRAFKELDAVKLKELFEEFMNEV